MTTLPIKLPPGFYPKVKTDDTVRIGDVIARKDPKPDEVIDLGKDLDVKVQDIQKHLQKDPGDKIIPGDVLAVKKSLFGERKVVSSVMGTIVSFNAETGKLRIRRKDEGGEEGEADAERMLSPLDGSIALCNNESIHIKTDKNAVVGVAGIGGGAEGELVAANGLLRKKDEEVIPAELVKEQIGKVIIGGVFTREVLAKAAAMGIAGIIAGNVEDRDLTYLTEKNMTLPLVILDDKRLQDVVKWIGKRVYIDGKGKTVLLLQYESKRA